MNKKFVTGVYAMGTYLTPYLSIPEHMISKLMKKASQEAYGEYMRGKTHSIGNLFLIKREFSTHEAFKIALSLSTRYSNKDGLYVPTSLTNNRTRMLKSLSILEKMHPDHKKVFASNLIGKYENRPDDLHSLRLADSASSYISKKAVDVLIEPDKLKKLQKTTTT